MLLEIAAGVLIVGGGLVAVAQKARRSKANSQGPSKATRSHFVELHDVLLVHGEQHCLVGEVIVLDGNKPLRLLVDTFGETPVWIRDPGSSKQELDVLRESAPLPRGPVPLEFTVDQRRYIAERSGHARTQCRGEAPAVSSPIRFWIYRAVGEHTAIVLDSPASRTVLVGERFRPGMYELLPGK